MCFRSLSTFTVKHLSLLYMSMHFCFLLHDFQFHCEPPCCLFVLIFSSFLKFLQLFTSFHLCKECCCTAFLAFEDYLFIFLQRLCWPSSSLEMCRSLQIWINHTNLWSQNSVESNPSLSGVCRKNCFLIQAIILFTTFNISFYVITCTQTDCLLLLFQWSQSFLIHWWQIQADKPISMSRLTAQPIRTYILHISCHWTSILL